MSPLFVTPGEKNSVLFGVFGPVFPIAKRKLKEEQDKSGRIDPVAEKKTLAELLQDYEKSLQQYDEKTVKTRKWILQTFKNTWRRTH